MTTLRQAAEMALDTLIELEKLLPVGISLTAINALRESLTQPDQLEGCKKILIERTASLTKANYRLEQLNKQEPTAWMDAAGDLTFRTPSVKLRPYWTPLYLHPTPVPDGLKLVPIEPTEEMIDCGAQGMASFQEDSVWPDSWDATQVKGMRHDAKKAYRYMLSAAPKPEELK